MGFDSGGVVVLDEEVILEAEVFVVGNFTAPIQFAIWQKA